MTGISSTINTADESTREHERIALMAVAVHMFEHALDAPHSIAIDRHGPRTAAVQISVHHDSADAWVESIAVDSRTSVPVSNLDIFNQPMLRHVVSGRLPDLGIRVQLRFFEVIASTRLTVVGA